MAEKMQHSNPNAHAAQSTQIIELTEEIPLYTGVSFNAGNLTLNGVYRDELSAHRAKRVWIATLENTFLLERAADFAVNIRGESEADQYTLTCEFISACARYAFWRLTNNQAPEAQYLIETGHIPQAESRHEDFLSAPDLAPEPSILDGLRTPNAQGPLHAIVQRILNRFRV